jgi:hypothetical protein
MSDVAVVTHGDVDGMTCAAQLIRRERGNCRIIFSNARWITHHLSQLAKDSLPGRIYITDIPANVRAAAVVRALVQGGAEVHWIDHHPWPEGLVERLRHLGAHIEHNVALNTPAGALLGGWLKSEDPYCEQISRICYASKQGTDWERNWFLLLASYVAKCDRAVLERLAFGQPFAPADLARIEAQRHAEERAEEVLAVPPRVETTAAGKRLAVYDLSGTPEVYLGSRVFLHHAVDYCLIRISARKWQLASAPSSTSVLQGLMATPDVGGLKIRVGGRPTLLSIMSDQRERPLDAHELIIAWAARAL